jgi:hypothetical protein
MSTTVSLPVPPPRLTIPVFEGPSATETALVKEALLINGLKVSGRFRLVCPGSSTAKLSMRSPCEGDISPRTTASTHCPPGFGPSSLARIEGNSSNGMFGKGLDLLSGHTIREYYMTRLLVDGTETYVPIQIEVRLEKSSLIFGEVLGAEY